MPNKSQAVFMTLILHILLAVFAQKDVPENANSQVAQKKLWLHVFPCLAPAAGSQSILDDP